MQDMSILNKFLEIQNKIKSYNIQNIGLYGTGHHTEKLLDFLDDECKERIIGLIDKEVSKINTDIYGYKVYDLDTIKSKVSTIIISSDIYQQIIYERIAFF